VNINYSEIQVGAYFKWLNRSKEKIKGNPTQDWIEAENEYFKEALKYLKNLHQSTTSHPSLDAEQFHDIYNVLGSASYSTLDSKKKCLVQQKMVVIFVKNPEEKQNSKQ
jgi:hypothetical protein